MKKPSKHGLGRGLDALFTITNDSTENDITTEKSVAEDSSLTEIKLIEIEPNKNQPRKEFDKEQLQSLANSIKEYGIIEPLVVKKTESGRYQIIAGERRWRAAKLAGLKTAPVVIKEYEGSTVMEVALIENLQRENLNPIEEALGYKSLIDSYDMTQEKISEKIGKSRSAVANSLRLLNLDPEVQKLIKEGKLSGGHARCLVVISDKKLQKTLANEIISSDLSVRQTEALIKKLQSEKSEKRMPEKDIYIKDLETKLTKKLGYKVKISQGTKKSKLEIDYYNNEDLDKILHILGFNN